MPNVTFTGVAAGDATSTLNTGDILTGSGGTNTFNITGNGDASTKLVQTTNVQDVYVRAVADTQVSQLLMSGVNNFASKGSNSNLTVNSANLSSKFWVIDSVSSQTTNLNIQYASATGSSDKANLSVQNAGSKVGATTFASAITTGNNNIESVSLDTSGTNYVTLAAGTAAKAITVTGSGTNTVVLSSAATTFSLDASATTGANTLDVGTLSGSTTSVIGGTAADVLVMNLNKALTYQPTVSAVETLEANFSVTGATYNASKTTDLTKAVITATASGGTAGFSSLSEDVVAVNVGKSSSITSGVVTVGYASGSNSDVTVRIGATSSTSDPVVDIDGLTVTGNKGSLTIHSVGDATNLITAALDGKAVLQANTATELTIAGVDRALTISNTDAGGADAVISATGANVITIDATKKDVTIQDTAEADNFIVVDESLAEFNVISDAGTAIVADLDFDSAAGDSNLTVNLTSGTKALTMGSVAVDGFAEKTITYVSNITGGKGTLTAGAVDINGGVTATNVATNVTYTANVIGGAGQIALSGTAVDAVDVGTLTANVTITGGEGNIDIADGGVAFDFETEIKALSATVNLTTGAGGIDTGDFVFNSDATGAVTGAAATTSFTATTAEEGDLTVDALILRADFTGSTLAVDLNAASGDVTVDSIDVIGATGLGTVSLTLAAAADQTLTITSLAESGGGNSQKIGSIVVSGAGDVTVGGSSFINSQATVVDATAATGSVNINLAATTGNLSVYLGNAGSSDQNTITTGSGTDYIVGGTGKDAIAAGQGADTILGGSGNDTMTGAVGADLLTGGSGNDTFAFSTGYTVAAVVTPGVDGTTKEVFKITTAGTYNEGQTITVANVATADVVYTVTAGAAASTATLLGELATAINGATGSVYDTTSVSGSVLTVTAAANGAKVDATSTLTLADSGVTLATADVITDFTTASDFISAGVTGSATTVTIASGAAFANFAAFSTAASTALDGTVLVYVAYDAVASGNAYVAVDTNRSGNFEAGDTLIVLEGVNLVTEIVAANFIA